MALLRAPEELRPQIRAELARFDVMAYARTLTVLSDDPFSPKRIPFEPWDYQAERLRAWADGESTADLKARQLGFTTSVDAYAMWRAELHNWAVAYISKGQLEARANLADRLKLMWQSREFRTPGRLTADSLTFDTGGKILVFPSTPDAGVQYTFQLVILDEFAFHQWAGANWAAILPTISAGGQVIVMSTADPDLGAAGAFYEVYTKAGGLGALETTPAGALRGREVGENGLRAYFTGVLARPGRAEAWLAAEVAKIGNERADAFYPLTPAQAFVGKHGLVFATFSVQRHVIPAHPIAWKDCKYRLVGIDMGGAGKNMTAGIPIGFYQDRGAWKVHQPTEFYREGLVSDQDVAEWWHQVDKQGRVMATVVDAGSGTSNTVETMKKLGVRCIPNQKDPAGRRKWTGDALSSGMLTIHASCVGSIKEFALYRWGQKVDPTSRERYTIHTPVDNHGDAIDARGMALQYAFENLLNEGPSVGKIAYAGKEGPPEDPEEYVRWKIRKMRKAAAR